MMDRTVDLQEVLAGRSGGAAGPPAGPSAGGRAPRDRALQRRPRRPRREAWPTPPPLAFCAIPGRWPRHRGRRERFPPRRRPHRPAPGTFLRRGPKFSPRCAPGAGFSARPWPRRTREPPTGAPSPLVLVESNPLFAERSRREAAAIEDTIQRHTGQSLRIRVTVAEGAAGGAEAAAVDGIVAAGRPPAGVSGQGSRPRHGGGCVRFGDRGLTSFSIALTPTDWRQWQDYRKAWRIFSSSSSSASRCRAGCSSCRPSSRAAPSRHPPAAAWSRSTADGRGTVRSVVIDPAVFVKHDAEFLADLVLAAVAEAQRRAAELLQAEMRKVPSLPFAPPF